MRVPEHVASTVLRMGEGSVTTGFGKLAQMLQIVDWRLEMMAHLRSAVDAARVKNPDAAEALEQLIPAVARVYDRKLNPAWFANVLMAMQQYGEHLIVLPPKEGRNGA